MYRVSLKIHSLGQGDQIFRRLGAGGFTRAQPPRVPDERAGVCARGLHDHGVHAWRRHGRGERGSDPRRVGAIRDAGELCQAEWVRCEGRSVDLRKSVQRGWNGWGENESWALGGRWYGGHGGRKPGCVDTCCYIGST
jgi:hypothetical protein